MSDETHGSRKFFTLNFLAYICFKDQNSADVRILHFCFLEDDWFWVKRALSKNNMVY